MTQFENPIVKKVTELEKGDVFRCEAGDFDNFITAVFESSEPYKCCRFEGIAISFHYLVNGVALTMVANIDDTVEVIGEE